MEKEKYSQDYYRELAAKANNKGLQKIFNMLANEEAKHYSVVEQMKSKIPERVSDTDVLSDANDIFEQMKEATDKFNFEANHVETYKKAQDIEKDSREFYLQKADEVQDHCQKGIFKRLAEEENKHYFLLENIIDFVSRPEQWLENAEFHHMEDY
jgi:rubrerythrin